MSHAATVNDHVTQLLERIVRKTPDFAPAKSKLEQLQKELADSKKAPGAA